MNMGLLIRQQNELWIIELRETWAIEDVNEAKEFANYCIEHLIPVDVNYNKSTLAITFCFGRQCGQTKLEFGDLKDMQKRLAELLDYKNKYGKLNKKECE